MVVTETKGCLNALQVGDHRATGANEIVRRDRKHVVPRSRCSPHLVVPQQIWIDEDAQGGAVAERRYAAVGFGNLFPQTEPGLASQVGFDKLPVFGISDGDLARDR